MSKATHLKAELLKAEKEAWVSNLHGGDISEINLVALVTPASVLLYSVLQSRLRLFTPYTPVAALTDFLLNCCTTLYATTLLSSNLTLLNTLLLAPAFILLIISRPRSPSNADRQRKPPPREASASSRDSTINPLPIKPFITTYRGTMIAITCIAILAVDFRVFPRRFAKAESWGTSLMDLGVGSFVFSAGTVAARPILKERLAGSSSSSSSQQYAGLATRLISAARHSLPLLALGVIRLLSVKNLSYAEHVSEYGVHWNFFFTLSLLPPLAAICDSLFRLLLPSYCALAIILAVAYEIVLRTTELQAYVLTAPRTTGWFSANREGVCSMAGYLAIFLAGQGVGMVALPRYDASSSSSPSTTTTIAKNIHKNPLLRRLLLWSLTWTLLFFLTTDYRLGLNLTVSRRLTNLPYVLWTAAFNTVQILLFALIEALCFPAVHSASSLSSPSPSSASSTTTTSSSFPQKTTKSTTKPQKPGEKPSTTSSREAESTNRSTDACTSRLLRAFNRNGLAVFLVANLLTGLVNMTVPTLRVGDVAAMGVLVGYMVVVSGVAVGLDAWDVSVKL